MNKRPEAGVVQVVNMTVSLSPREIISDGIGRWVKNHPTIKGRWVNEGRGGEERGPIEHIASSEVGRHCRHNLTRSSAWKLYGNLYSIHYSILNRLGDLLMM